MPQATKTAPTVAELLGLSFEATEAIKSLLPTLGIKVDGREAPLIAGVFAVLWACKWSETGAETKKEPSEKDVKDFVVSEIESMAEALKLRFQTEDLQFEQLKGRLDELLGIEAERVETSGAIAKQVKQQLLVEVGYMRADLRGLFEQLELLSGLHIHLPRPGAEVHMSNRLTYWQRTVPLFGRGEILEQLRGFLDCPGDFMWWLMTGPGGVGKSRVALELCYEALAGGWDAGFLSKIGDQHWGAWQPKKRTLVVVDSVLARQSTKWGDVLNELANKSFEHEIRFLFIDRPNDAEFWDDFFSEARPRSEFFFGTWSMRGSGDEAGGASLRSLEVRGLDDAGVRMVMEFSARRSIQAGLSVDWNAQVADYRKIDSLGRPLFATIAGEMLAKGKAFRGRSLKALSLDVLEGFVKGWLVAGVDEKHFNLLLLATLGGDLDLDSEECQKLRRLLPDLLPAEFDENQVRLLASISSDFNLSEPILPRLLPDPIGEVYAIKLLQGHGIVSARGNTRSRKQKTQRVLEVASRAFGEGVQDFTTRLCNDHPKEVACLESTTVLGATGASLDLAPLVRFTKLEQLFLKKCSITDLNPLAGLTSLTHLNLNYCHVRDIAPLAGLTNLVDLRLNSADLRSTSKSSSSLTSSHDQLSQMDHLKGLKALTYLSLNDAKGVRNLSALKDLKELATLRLKSTRISDISPLKDLRKLIDLQLNETNVEDLKPLRNFKSLKRLNLASTKIADILPLACLKDLKLLFLNSTSITVLHDIEKLISLEVLKLDKTEVRSVSSLRNMIALTSLSLRETKVEDVSPLAALNSLTYLDLCGTPVSDVSPLKGLTSLIHLNIECKMIEDISVLKSLINLKVLMLGGSGVTDLSALANLERLRNLRLNDTNIVDISVLRHCVLLKELGLRATKVEDISALKDLKHLRVLDLQSTSVMDLKWLVDVASLRCITVYDTDMASSETATLKMNNPSLKVVGYPVRVIVGLS